MSADPPVSDESSESPPPSSDSDKTSGKNDRDRRDRSDETEDREADDEASEAAQQQVDAFREAAEAATGDDAEETTTAESQSSESQDQTSDSATGGASGGSGGAASGGEQTQTTQSGEQDGKFDQSPFVEANQSDRGPAADAFPPEHSEEDDRVGGWDDYTQDAVTKEMEIQKSAEGAGFTSDDMQLDRIPDAPTEADEAFVTRYSNYAKMTGGSLLANQVTMYAVKESLGFDGPRMAFETGKNGEVRAVSEDVDTANGIATQTVNSLKDSDIADKVDPDEFLETLSFHLLMGDWDGKSDNVRIGDDGSVHMVDYDRTDRKYGSAAEIESAASRSMGTIESLDVLRSDDALSDVGTAELTDRACEMAAEIRATNDLDALEANIDGYLNHVEEVAESANSFNADEMSGPSRLRPKSVRNNIEIAANDHST